jgi:hypothetical protein
VGGASIQIVHYFDHGYLEEEKSMIHSFTVTFGLGLWRLTPLSTIVQLYRGVNFICVGKRSALRKPSTCHKSLTHFITGYLEEEKSMIHSFTVTFGAKYLTGIITSVPPYETFSLIKNGDF